MTARRRHGTWLAIPVLVATACGSREPARLDVRVSEVVTEASAHAGAETSAAASAPGSEAGEAMTAQAGSRRSSPAGVETLAQLAPGQRLAVSYDLGNAGGRPLLLYSVVPACGCTLTADPPTVLEPGERALVAVACRAPWTPDETVRELTISCSDPAHPVARVPLRMRVPAATSDPAVLHFGYVPVGGSAAHQITAPAGLPGVAARPPASDDPAIQVEPRSPGPDGRRSYVVRFSPRTPGVVRATVDLGSDAAAIAVSGVGYGDLVAFPAEVRLPGVAGGGAPLPIAVKDLGAGAHRALRVDYPPDLGGELQAGEGGRDFRILLRRRAPTRAGARDAGGAPAAPSAIRIFAAGSEEPLLVIPVRREAMSRALENVAPRGGRS